MGVGVEELTVRIGLGIPVSSSTTNPHRCTGAISPADKGGSDTQGTALGGLPPAVKGWWAASGVNATGLGLVCPHEVESEDIAAVETRGNQALGSESNRASCERRMQVRKPSGDTVAALGRTAFLQGMI